MTRAAGVPNKNKRGLKAQLKQQYGEEFDVIMMMAENCLTLHSIAKSHKEGGISVGETGVIDASSSAKIANESLEKLAQYIEPKLKSVEVTGEDGGPIKTDNKFTIEIIKPNA